MKYAILETNQGRRASILEPRNNSPVFAIAHLSLICVIYLAYFYCLHLYMLDILVLYCYMLGIVCSHLYSTKRAIVTPQLLSKGILRR